MLGAALFAGAGFHARGQSVLDLEHALSLAERSSPSIHIAENALRTAELSLSELNTTGLPQLGAVLNGVYTPSPPTFGYDPAVTNGGELSARIVLRQTLYDAGIRSLRSDQLSGDRARLAHESRLAQLDLALSVKLAFAEALRSEAASALGAQSVEQLESYLSLLKRLYAGGGASATDLLKTEVETSSARMALMKSREDASGAKIALEEIVGLPPDTSLALAGSLSDSAQSPQETAQGGGKSSPDSTIDMTVAGMLIERSLVEEDIARRESLPAISFVADAGYLSSGDNFRVPPSERLNGIGYSVGIGIELPIFTWGAIGLRTEQRAVATDDLRGRMELLRRSIAADQRRVGIQLANARARLGPVRENSSRAEQNFILTKSKFAAGAALSLEVLSAQQTLTEARLAELQALADIRSLQVRLERLIAR